ncbi:pyridine nucleotide-disulfide oxidoreductase domain-containing protein [Myxococcus stipitatus DSM 14675]|uniref:Pyridine nucleotide-disulfide oxidoreductase domain-containing protein n=1 Tax=Myxococcus stipitatus (strain DSM 14675 / JCM 12634 / Mx s8) TaxID=1278073 RepID=L7U1S2_MYXSD|nr:FAD/NAD(P)-binding oxidoreductase [Myxococcus stipitatus]AGC42143.1 pyridine nucleotide-disulfide oxidoreductase domain-containing protein [Myxococcus stipitatus DSM 14675]
MRETCDLVVIGAGPGGLAAASVAAEAGLKVLVLDAQPEPGGQVWRGEARQGSNRLARRWLNRFAASGARFRPGARVIAAPEPGVLLVEEGASSFAVRYGRAVLATGARERFLPFPGWTLPGVMGVSGLQVLVKDGFPIEGKRVVLAGTGPLLLAAAATIHAHGGDVLFIAEQASAANHWAFALQLWRHPSKLLQGAALTAKLVTVPNSTEAWVLAAEGSDRVESVRLSVRGREEHLRCDYLGAAYGLVPNLELPRLLGCEVSDGAVVVNERLETRVPGVHAVGELLGIGGVDQALVTGELAGLVAAQRPVPSALERSLQGIRTFATHLARHDAPREELRRLATPDTLLCRCEDVPLSALEGCTNLREARLYARLGMGACQGRTCGAAAQTLFGWSGEDVRPPCLPARIGSLRLPPDVSSSTPTRES